MADMPRQKKHKNSAVCPLLAAGFLAASSIAPTLYSMERPPAQLPIVEELPSSPPLPWDTIGVMVRTNPRHPEDERFYSWRLEAFNISDRALRTSPSYFGETGPDGTASLGLPNTMFNAPLVIKAKSDLLALECSSASDTSGYCEQGSFEIFVPPYCYDKAVWMLGPLEDAMWQYYKRAASHEGEAWNASQVDCGTWLADLQLLILTDRISDALDKDMRVKEALTLALQENQQLLVPTRPPLCLATQFHEGGPLREEKHINLPQDLSPSEIFELRNRIISDPIIVGEKGLVENLCGFAFKADLRVNGVSFNPSDTFTLQSDDFLGTVSQQKGILPWLDVSAFNVRLGNGRPLDNDAYKTSCAVSTLFKFENTHKDDEYLVRDTGVQISGLFGEAPYSALLYKTSSGDAVIDQSDTWAIFYDADSIPSKERVIAVELLGHREKDYRDALHLKFDAASSSLFLGLRADYELDERHTDGEEAYMAYTIHAWDGSSPKGEKALKSNLVNCFEASNVWARQFFSMSELESEGSIKPLAAAEYAVRSQCYSNSRANSRWQNDVSSFWNIGSNKGALGNVVVNAGWLAPNLDFSVYIQKFDEAVFKGPRTIKRTDDLGQLMLELPTLVEGDRVLLKAIDPGCSDYDLVIPCIPEFSGFAGVPGVPYIPQPLRPIPRPQPPLVKPISPGPIPYPQVPVTCPAKIDPK